MKSACTGVAGTEELLESTDSTFNNEIENEGKHFLIFERMMRFEESDEVKKIH